MILPLHNRYALDEENTIGVACISYGKDSLAELRAIEKLKLPLHRILHSEVWATPTIPADLPPMVEFKAKADEIIYQRYGIKVEHICAMQNGGGYSPTKICSTKKCQAESMKEHTEVSLLQQEDGAENSKLIKLTYQDIFYRQLGGGIYGFPILKGNWCSIFKRTRLRDLRQGGVNIAQENSRNQYSSVFR